MRDSNVEELMADVCTREHFSQDGEAAAPEAKRNRKDTIDRPKKTLIDDIPDVIQLEVEAVGGVVYQVKVLSSWKAKGLLHMELSEKTMECLLSQPAISDASFRPVSNEPNVLYNPMFHCTFIKYFDRKANKLRTKQCKLDPPGTNAEIQVEFAKKARPLQEFYVSHHNVSDE